ncbi:MAG: DNA-binding protein WhiA [Ruminococcus sp.]|nr:DNA-binding protein WhiA [Ruminococcus sp.]
MSFSNDVRTELRTAVRGRTGRAACLYGMLLFCRTIAPDEICFQSESSVSAEFFAELFSRVFGTELVFTEKVRRSGAVLRSCRITDASLISEVYTRYSLGNGRHILRQLVNESNAGAFAAGAFLAAGSVNDPSKEYHLEFSSPEEPLAAELLDMLAEIGVKAKYTLRRGQYVVYVKDSDSIEDVLTFMGASQCTLDMINICIFKDVRNKANRIANCDSANIDKVVEASIKQIADIRLIDETIGLSVLPDDLREIAALRLENDGMSLKEIGESLSVPLTRSGVNHRFRRIAKIADEIRNGGNAVEK